MKYTFRLPDVGEGIHEAEIVSYEVIVGDEVKADQIIIKIETDKAVVTLPAPSDGKILEIPRNPGDIVSVGDPLIILETDAIRVIHYIQLNSPSLQKSIAPIVQLRYFLE